MKLRRLISRALQGIATVIAVYLLTFAMVVAIPGNPLQQGSRRLAPETEAALRTRYRMDNNWVYLGQMVRDATRLDFGPTYHYPDWTCGEILRDALPVSITLGATALALALCTGVPLGVWAALRRSSWLDPTLVGTMTALVSIPPFVVGSLLLVFFSVELRWLPVCGWGSWRHLILPAVTLALPFAAYIMRLTRASMLESLSADYVRTARAKGLPRRTVIWRHAFRPALLPVLAYVGPASAQAMTGSFVVERVFCIPGLGQHFVNAALNQDAGLILTTALVYTTLLVAMNVAVDAVSAWVDPRVAHAV